MEGPDVTHPAVDSKPDWEPERPEDEAMKKRWKLGEEEGVVCRPHHPCKGDTNAATIVPLFRANPAILRSEIATVGLRVISVDTDKDPNAKWPTVTMVACKERVRCFMGQSDTA